MKITVCIGSSCHLKGAGLVIEELLALIGQHGLGSDVELVGEFCMGNCINGVSVKLEERLLSLRPETTKAFFQEEVLKSFMKPGNTDIRTEA